MVFEHQVRRRFWRKTSFEWKAFELVTFLRFFVRVKFTFGKLRSKVGNILFIFEDRHKRRVHFLNNEIVPVSLIEPRVFFDIFSMFQPFLRILLKQFSKKISQVFAPLVVHKWLWMFDFFKELVSIFNIERRKSIDQFIDNSSKTPPIYCFSMPFFIDHFRGQVLRSSTYRKSLTFRLDIAPRSVSYTHLTLPTTPYV